jgi:hypothetical protein
LRQNIEKSLSRSSFGACARAPEAEFYAKLSKLPKLYMVTPRNRQGNGAGEHGGTQQKIGVRAARTAIECGNYSVEICYELGSIENGGRNLLANS